jgi:hypothetical protein
VYANLIISKEDYYPHLTLSVVPGHTAKKNGYDSLFQLSEDFNTACKGYAEINSPCDMTEEDEWSFYFKFIFR